MAAVPPGEILRMSANLYPRVMHSLINRMGTGDRIDPRLMACYSRIPKPLDCAKGMNKGRMRHAESSK